ncbi:MAG TPA: HAD-IIIA family hydrolase, partial [Thermoleophilaceae bacterium]|nr:HAD-IIIA family hydrolase [Thermoleophilaceae bacterium]
ALAEGAGPLPERVLVVDDRREPAPAPELGEPGALGPRLEIVPGPGRGPAAARNAGWRRARAEWVAFLDDDVVPDGDWRQAVIDDLGGAGPRVGAVQGRVRVPLPPGRRPTDWERNTAGLEVARWATADMAYRRAALLDVGGFDERFERAYREDADIGLRLLARGWQIVEGSRQVTHPARPAGALVSLRKQAGNADDVLMRALHGPDWRERAGAPAGRLARHQAVTLAGLTGVALAAGRRAVGRSTRAEMPSRLAAAAPLTLWAAGTAELAWRRIAPGPRTPAEVATMLLTSALMPPLATLAWARGHARRRRLLADTARAPKPAGAPAAVLLDRDGTLVVDVPYNGDPALVRPLPGVREALERLRAAGVPLAVVSNQSGIARGLITAQQVDAVNRRVAALLGPLGPWMLCPHGPDDGCECRKPKPGMVREAAWRLGVPAAKCVFIGDIGADMQAARAAGARGILVPTERTLIEEVRSAGEVAPSLEAAVELLLGPVALTQPSLPRVAA